MSKNSKKCTHMSAERFRQIRQELGCDPRDMCAALGLKRRTHQSYEAGVRGIPEAVAVKAEKLAENNLKFMKNLPVLISSWVKRDYPEGIPSEPCE